jgi:hypothetical protein
MGHVFFHFKIDYFLYRNLILSYFNQFIVASSRNGGIIALFLPEGNGKAEIVEQEKRI